MGEQACGLVSREPARSRDGVLRLELPRGRALTGALLFGLLDVGGAFGLGYYARVALHAGFGSILLALVPLAALLLAVLQGQERLRVAAVAGTLVALGGVALMPRFARFPPLSRGGAAVTARSPGY